MATKNLSNEDLRKVSGGDVLTDPQLRRLRIKDRGLNFNPRPIEGGGNGERDDFYKETPKDGGYDVPGPK